jgi:hypothetical protein
LLIWYSDGRNLTLEEWLLKLWNKPIRCFRELYAH